MRNVFRIQRLKDKLGNRSNASAEVEFDGTVGFILGEPGPRRAHDHRDGAAHPPGLRARHRRGHAAVRRRGGLARAGPRGLRRAARRPARDDRRCSPTSPSSPRRRCSPGCGSRSCSRPRHPIAMSRCAGSRRPSSKYWVCKRGPHHAYEALECLGGNGYTESFPLARRYREQPVMAIWEGSGNVIALDVLRALTRDPDSAAAFADELATTAGASAVLDAHVARTLALLERARRRRRRRRADPGATPERVARAGVPGLAHAPPRAVASTPRPSSPRGSARTAARSTACSRGDGCRGHRRAH